MLDWELSCAGLNGLPRSPASPEGCRHLWRAEAPSFCECVRQDGRGPAFRRRNGAKIRERAHGGGAAAFSTMPMRVEWCCLTQVGGCGM